MSKNKFQKINRYMKTDEQKREIHRLRSKKWREEHPNYNKERNKKQYDADPKANVERVKEWRRNNRDWCNQNQREWAKRKPEKQLWYGAKARSKKYSIPFDIAVEDIIIPEFCPILGIPLFRGNNVSSFNSPTLDRTIPSLGYTQGNIQVISFRANTIKNDATAQELRKVANWLDLQLDENKQVI